MILLNVSFEVMNIKDKYFFLYVFILNDRFDKVLILVYSIIINNFIDWILFYLILILNEILFLYDILE